MVSKFNLIFENIGAVEIAAVGVSIAIFNQASKVTIFPLVSITTSFVAEEDTVERILSREAAKVLENNINIDKSTTTLTKINIIEMEKLNNEEEETMGENLEKDISVKKNEMKELKQEDEVPMELEKGSTSETKDLTLEDGKSFNSFVNLFFLLFFNLLFDLVTRMRTGAKSRIFLKKNTKFMPIFFFL